jgi:HSP20 family protein
MMTITRYEPWSLLEQFQRQLDRFNDERSDTTSAVTSWSPAVDIKEEDDRFVLKADLPGVKPDEIDVTMEDGVLTVRGERVDEKTDQQEGYKRVERFRGSFYRRFTLPDTTDSENISANYEHGVLELSIPKKAAVQPKRITVNG